MQTFSQGKFTENLLTLDLNYGYIVTEVIKL